MVCSAIAPTERPGALRRLPNAVTLVVRFSHAPNAATIVGSDVVLAIANAERAFSGRDSTVIAPPAVAPLTPQASM